jgi:opacity protein-like surface antigen
MKRQIVLIAAVAALLLGLAISAAGAAPANPVSLPVAGTPSAAGINAAPDTTYTQWEYTSLDNQGGHTFGQPGSERVTFVGPVEVVIVGDGALEYNHAVRSHFLHPELGFGDATVSPCRNVKNVLLLGRKLQLVG